jgi:hypothetical protein
MSGDRDDTPVSATAAYVGRLGDARLVVIPARRSCRRRGVTGAGPAAGIEPLRAIASSRSALPGPSATAEP